LDALKGVLADVDKGVRLGYAKDWKNTPSETSAAIDVAIAMAKAWPDGLDAVVDVLVATGRGAEDNYLLAAVNWLSSLLPEAAPAAIAWRAVVRGRRGIGAVARGVVSAHRETDKVRDANGRQASLFDVDPKTVEESQ